MRRGYVGVLLICACGARSEIAGSGGDDVWLDGSIFDATSGDVGNHWDASPFPPGDAGADVITLDGCTTLVVGVGCAGNKPDCQKYGCKFDVEWSCGDTKWRVGGACMPPDGGPGVYEGVCDENGQQTSTFNTPTTSCDCEDASALVTVVQEKCTHQ